MNIPIDLPDPRVDDAARDPSILDRPIPRPFVVPRFLTRPQPSEEADGTERSEIEDSHAVTSGDAVESETSESRDTAEPAALVDGAPSDGAFVEGAFDGDDIFGVAAGTTGTQPPNGLLSGIDLVDEDDSSYRDERIFAPTLFTPDAEPERQEFSPDELLPNAVDADDLAVTDDAAPIEPRPRVVDVPTPVPPTPRASAQVAKPRLLSTDSAVLNGPTTPGVRSTKRPPREPAFARTPGPADVRRIDLVEIAEVNERLRVRVADDPLDALLAEHFETVRYGPAGLVLSTSIRPPAGSGSRDYGANPTRLDLQWDQVAPMVSRTWSEACAYEFYAGSNVESWLEVDEHFVFVHFEIDEEMTVWKWTHAFRTAVEDAALTI